MIKTEILKTYAKEGLNVLLTGRHGVGKTAIVKEVFNDVFGEHYTNWRYFSASTLDPWVDFIGVPKNYTRPDGKEVFGIIPPEHFTGEENIQAIFFDEINRAESKTLNALMELIQFKSINGRKFPNLKCVWGAENPANDDEQTYSVQELDPAQKDRFQIQLIVPEELNKSYFVSKYGEDIYSISNSWWVKNKSKISPRKLDDMLYGYMKGFDMNHFTTSINVKELQSSLSSISEIERAKIILDSKNIDEIKKKFTIDYIRKNEKIFSSVLNKTYLQKIYDNTSGEVNRYVGKNFGVKTILTSIPEGNMTGSQVAFMESIHRKYNNLPAHEFYGGSSYTVFNRYITDFDSVFSNAIDKNFNGNDALNFCKKILPLKFESLSTFEFRKIASDLNISKIENRALINWIAILLYNISMVKNKTNLKLISELKKMFGNKDMVSFAKLNKIAFNEYLSFGSSGATLEEMKHRLKV